MGANIKRKKARIQRFKLIQNTISKSVSIDTVLKPQRIGTATKLDKNINKPLSEKTTNCANDSVVDIANVGISDRTKATRFICFVGGTILHNYEIHRSNWLNQAISRPLQPKYPLRNILRTFNQEPFAIEPAKRPEFPKALPSSSLTDTTEWKPALEITIAPTLTMGSLLHVRSM